MGLGLHYWNFTAPGDPQRIADTLAAAAKTAEQAGFAEFSVMDHYFQIEQRAGAEELDQADAAGSATVARRITENRMMVTAKQIAARRNITGPAHHLELGMA
jgi:alkanesulfonate monooxygenase SsuD/methylene tetrahydromethanopterin reductase-like flavin-dependent oxidoreductase (luciferase family)